MYSVALSDDSEMLVIGMPDVGKWGKVCVYKKTDEGWTLVADVTDSRISDLGTSVSIVADHVIAHARILESGEVAGGLVEVAIDVPSMLVKTIDPIHHKVVDRSNNPEICMSTDRSEYVAIKEMDGLKRMHYGNVVSSRDDVVLIGDLIGRRCIGMEMNSVSDSVGVLLVDGEVCMCHIYGLVEDTLDRFPVNLQR